MLLPQVSVTAHDPVVPEINVPELFVAFVPMFAEQPDTPGAADADCNPCDNTSAHGNPFSPSELPPEDVGETEYAPPIRKW
jgi:hypothetical protein